MSKRFGQAGVLGSGGRMINPSGGPDADVGDCVRALSALAGGDRPVAVARRADLFAVASVTERSVILSVLEAQGDRIHLLGSASDESGSGRDAVLLRVSFRRRSRLRRWATAVASVRLVGDGVKIAVEVWRGRAHRSFFEVLPDGRVRRVDGG